MREVASESGGGPGTVHPRLPGPSSMSFGLVRRSSRWLSVGAYPDVAKSTDVLDRGSLIGCCKPGGGRNIMLCAVTAPARIPWCMVV